MEFNFHLIYLLPFVAAVFSIRYRRRALAWLILLISALVALGYLCLVLAWPFEDTAINTVVVTLWGMSALPVLRAVWRTFRRRMRRPRFFAGFAVILIVTAYVAVPGTQQHLAPLILLIISSGIILVAYRVILRPFLGGGRRGR